MIGFEVGDREPPRLNRPHAGRRQRLVEGTKPIAARRVASLDHVASLPLG